MKFREAVKSDINAIMNIIKQAQEYLKIQGINQWQNNYPNVETIERDISNKNSYILLQNNIVVGTTAVIFGEDKNYNHIYDGSWISNDKYAAVHRIAVESDNKGFGLASVMLNNIETIALNKDVHSIRVDTHEKNKSMQKLLRKNNFQYCGIIYLEDGSKRLAFEKIF